MCEGAVTYWRYCWALPPTMVGLILASLALVGGRVRVVAGVIEAHGPWLRWALSTCVPLSGGAAAITFGHVVLGRDQHALTLTRAHERVHVRQYERWGVLFLPAYLAASVYAVISGGHYYFDNVFEREADRPWPERA
jgi:membrane protein YqaA with SNARE-associated domain